MMLILTAKQHEQLERCNRASGHTDRRLECVPLRDGTFALPAACATDGHWTKWHGFLATLPRRAVARGEMILGRVDTGADDERVVKMQAEKERIEAAIAAKPDEAVPGTAKEAEGV
ncbi:MAG: hypothetical protein AB1705_08540 [Verrucomicrobiota bacterium]